MRRADGKNVIEVDLERAPKVLQLFERYATGDVSLKDLVKWADGVGLRSKKGNKLGRSGVHAMLKNPLYRGEFDWHGVTYEAAHQPRVSRELQSKVLELLGERALVSRMTQFREFAFSGLLRCAWCASEDRTCLLVGEIHEEKYVYYTCQECKRLGRVVYHREPMIEQAFLEALQRLWVDAEVLDALREALRESHAELSASRNRAIGRLEAQRQAIQARVDRANDDRLDGRVTVEEYERRAAGWREEIARLSREIQAHGGADHATVEQGFALLELATMAVRRWEMQDAAGRRKILSFLCSSCTFGEEGLTVDWREPFDQLAEWAAELTDANGRKLRSSAERPEWLPTPRSGLTGPEERVNPEELWPVVETPRAKRLRERAERRERVRANPPAAEALRTAMAWAVEMEATGIRKADIARRERITRARVTQVMSLLMLPEDVKARLLAGGEPVQSGRR